MLKQRIPFLVSFQLLPSTNADSEEEGMGPVSILFLLDHHLGTVKELERISNKDILTM